MTLKPPLAALLTAALGGLPLPACATLGQDAASISTDQLALQAPSLSNADRGGYRQYEMTTASGTLVREFTNAAGTVFAVTWRGPWLPDLQQLMGSYFSAFAGRTRSGQRDHRHATLDRSDLVVRSSGRMRAFSGFAYLPAQMPAGMTREQLQ